MVLFIAAMLLIGTTAQAADQKHSDHQDRVAKRYHPSNSIVFIEGGVKFFINPQGDIDFKILRRGPRYGRWNNAPGTTYHRGNRYHNQLVRYDYYGRLKRVGSNYINYDRYNRVRRVGGVTLRYNRRGLVYQVGGLHVFYTRFGRIHHVEGNVHFDGCGYCGIEGCSAPHDPYYNQNWKSRPHYKHDDDDDDDDDHYRNRRRFKKHHDHDDDDD